MSPKRRTQRRRSIALSPNGDLSQAVEMLITAQATLLRTHVDFESHFDSRFGRILSVMGDIRADVSNLEQILANLSPKRLAKRARR